MTSRKPSAPGWAPWLGRGFCWKGCSHLLGAGPLCCTRRGIVPREVPGQKTQVATVCLLSRVWGEALVTAGQQWRAGWGLLPSVLRWTPVLPQTVGEMDVRGHRWPFVLYMTSCLSAPTVSHPRGQPLAFQYPPTPQAALTSASGESLAIISPFSYCRIYRNLWQNDQKHGF